MAGYCQRCCPNFKVGQPLTKMARRSVLRFLHLNVEQAAFEQLNIFLIHDPVLPSPDFAKSFSLHTDASDQTVGSALLQEKEGVLHPVTYHSV